MTEPTPDLSQSTERTDEQIKSLLLSADEMHQTYTRLEEDGIDINTDPLVFVKKEADKQLVYLGVHHSNEPDRPDLGHILSAWDRFIAETQAKDRVALIEGGLRAVETSQDTALATWGEPGLIAYLAHKDGVELATPEPDRNNEVLAVAKAAGLDETIYYYFARTLRQWQRISPGESFEEYVGPYLGYYQRMVDGQDDQFSFDYMTQMYRQKHGIKFDAMQPIDPKDATPGYNPAATACSDYRNVHMTKEIIRLWNEGKSIFIVYGSGHLITQEEALKKLLK